LHRFVTRTCVDGVPIGTGRSSASTGSTMQVSELKTKAEPSGSVTPMRPSVDPKRSKIGTPKPARMVARSSSVSISLVVTTACGRMSRPAAASRARTVG
jgi:hypothetical protein